MSKPLCAFILLIAVIFSVWGGEWLGRTNERAKSKEQRTEIIMDNINYKYELSRCRGWVDGLGRQIVKERSQRGEAKN